MHQMSKRRNNLEFIREKQYNYVLHFMMSTTRHKFPAFSAQDRGRIKAKTIDELLNSKEKVFGFSKIIERHSLKKFPILCKIDLGGSDEVYMFSQDELDYSQYVEILVLIKNNPNLNLVIDNVIKKLKEMPRFKNWHFEISGNDVVTIYYLSVTNDKFEFDLSNSDRAKVETVIKDEYTSRNFSFQTIIFYLMALVIIYICLGTLNVDNQFMRGLASFFVAWLVNKTFDKVDQLLNDKFNRKNNFLVLNMNYNFEDELKSKIEGDPNISERKLQAPREE